MAAGREQFFLAIKKELSKDDCKCFVWTEKGEICSNEKSTFLVSWKLVYLFTDIFSLEVAEHFTEITMDTAWRLLFEYSKNLMYILSRIYKYTEVWTSAYIIRCCQYLHSCKDLQINMLISMQWTTFQFQECKQKRRMIHKQKY